MLKIPFDIVLFSTYRFFSKIRMIEVQMKKGLWWIPRHPEPKKGVEIDEMLRGAENKHGSGDTRIGEPM